MKQAMTLPIPNVTHKALYLQIPNDPEKTLVAGIRDKKRHPHRIPQKKPSTNYLTLSYPQPYSIFRRVYIDIAAGKGYGSEIIRILLQ
jgi:hypothetical protein